jgi:chromosome segregation ATPase
MATEREEELLRLNAELAAEIRRLTAREIERPRAGQSPSARRLSRLDAEREELLSERDELRAERDRLRNHLDEQSAHGDSLAGELAEANRQNADLSHEVHRLRSGLPGLLRRAWARLRRRR